MKVAEKADHKVRTFGVESKEKEFKMLATAKSFKILMDGIYQNKIKAIIRELSTNARDSHVAAGHNKPFIVHLPHHHEPEFYIEDFGTGLSDVKIEEVYSTFFASDKEDSNDYVGCLGLGSKTPFCYNTRSFTVESWFNGTHYIYSCYINDYDKPAYIKLLEEDSERENGVKISFPVNSVDFYTFKREALAVYQFFDIKPKFVGSEKLTDDQLKFDDTVFKLQNCDIVNRSSYVLMGNIAYPINNTITNLDSIYKNYHIKLTLNIGDVDIETSREGLSYTKKTLEKLKEIANAIRKEVTEIVEKEIAGAKTLYEAAKKYHNYDSILADMTRNLKIQWKGKDLPSSSIAVEGFSIYKYSKQYYNNSIRKSVSYDVNFKRPIIINDMDKGGIVRTKQFVLNLPKKDYSSERSAYLLEPSLALVNGKIDQTYIQKLCDSLGASTDDLYFTSKLPYTKPTHQSTSKGVALTEYMVYNRDAISPSHVWETPTKTPTSGLYIKRKGYQIYDKNGDLTTYNHLATQLKRLSNIDSTIQIQDVYGIRPSDEDDLDKTKWTNVWNYLDIQTENVKKKKYENACQIYVENIEFTNCSYELECLKEYSHVIDKNSELYSLILDFDRVKKIVNTDLGETNLIVSYFGKPDNSFKSKFDLHGRLEKLKTKYPELNNFLTKYYNLSPKIFQSYILAVDNKLV